MRIGRLSLILLLLLLLLLILLIFATIRWLLRILRLLWLLGLWRLMVVRTMITSVAITVAQLDGDDMRSSGWFGFCFRHGDVIHFNGRRRISCRWKGHIRSTRRRRSACHTLRFRLSHSVKNIRPNWVIHPSPV